MGRMKIMRSVTMIRLVVRGQCDGSNALMGSETNPVFAHHASWFWQNVALTVKSHVACKGMQYVRTVAIAQRFVTTMMKSTAKQARLAHSKVKMLR